MMGDRCLDLDRLMSLCVALDWRPTELLSHLKECPDCRSSLERLEGLRSALSESMQPDPGFTSRVLGAIDPVPVDDTRAGSESGAGIEREREIGAGEVTRSPGRGWRLLNATLAAVTTFVALMVAGSGGPAVIPAVAMLLALAAGTSVWVWEERRSGAVRPRPA